jgi:CRISPR-associated exonuclease Cas4
MSRIRSTTSAESARTVDYKRGKRKKWLNDDVQLCAQALCLEEMLETVVSRGAIFHAQSKRRREVEFTAAVRAETMTAIERLHVLLSTRTVPRAVLKPQCDGCSLHEVCLPELGARLPAAAREMFSAGE